MWYNVWSWTTDKLIELKLKLLASEYQQVKITSKIDHFGDPLEGRELSQSSKWIWYFIPLSS